MRKVKTKKNSERKWIQTMKALRDKEAKGEKCTTYLIKTAGENRDSRQAILEQMIVENFLNFMKQTKENQTERKDR